ncbi:MAG TPA: MGMT family protein [Gammaproteobacteria bacterium]|nr:MGMT family protein [Gammaproteobacteria bacterium]
MSGFQEKFDRHVWEVVAAIPPGRVMGYGEVARAAGFPRYSRMVGASMGRSPDPLPWHRVVRSNRTLAFEQGSSAYREQARLLKQEGVRFDGPRVIEVETNDSLDRILWGPQD